MLLDDIGLAAVSPNSVHFYGKLGLGFWSSFGQLPSCYRLLLISGRQVVGFGILEMAYRRKQQGISKPSTFEKFVADEGIQNPAPPPPLPSYSYFSFADAANDTDSSFPSSPPSLAAKAIRASSARRDSSLSSAYGHSNVPAASPNVEPIRPARPPFKYLRNYEYTSIRSLNESKHGFWEALARTAKSIIDDDVITWESKTPVRIEPQMSGAGFTSKEGLTLVENCTSDIIQETRKHINKKPGNSEGQNENQETNHSTSRKQPHTWTQLHPQMQSDQELQLKASRDVAMAMAAKAKLRLRELKSVKADLAFVKQQCSQLEEENKILCENHERGHGPEDDDLIRLQLETLLAEKTRLAHENSVYARENLHLREVVEFHQLTMQDLVYFDEIAEELTEVNSLNLPKAPNMPPESLASATPAQSTLC